MSFSIEMQPPERVMHGLPETQDAKYRLESTTSDCDPLMKRAMGRVEEPLFVSRSLRDEELERGAVAFCLELMGTLSCIFKDR